ncbi:N-acetylmuramoyl-L-alanine amidase [Solibacillus merdavium]|nr:N-acetylmuramoyl-L-alanine amidase [Solibacillus merdavium]
MCDRGLKRANFAVLRETSIPAVLIEYGFIK